MEEKYNNVKELLEKYNQEQLLVGYENLDENTKLNLLNEILTIDFKQIEKLYNNTKKSEKILNEIIEPIDFIEKATLIKEEENKYKYLGENIIKNGQYAVITMAGGQRNKIRT